MNNFAMKKRLIPHSLSHFLFQDQYVFCHEVVNTYLDNFDTYANFEFKQLI